MSDIKTSSKGRFILPFLFFLFSLPVILRAQTKVSSDGTDFIFALMPIGNGSGATIPGSSQYAIQIAGYDSATVSLFNFDYTGKEVLIWSSAFNPETGLINDEWNDALPSGRPLFQALHLVSTRPVSVQLLTEGNDDGELSLLLPTVGLGTTYVAESYPNAPAQWSSFPTTEWNALPGRSMFVVAAPYDSTSVTYIPSCFTANGDASGSKNTILLRRGQIYMIEADTTSSFADISGTVITSDKPIAVFAGNNNPLLPDLRSYTLKVPSDNFRNPIVETMLPSWSWDSTGYVSIPFYPVTTGATTPGGDGDLYRCFGSNNPNVIITDLNGGIPALNSGINENTPVSIDSKEGKTFSAIQYDYFSGTDDKVLQTLTSPDASVLIPISAWKNRYAWMVPDNSVYGGGQYVNMIGPSSTINRVSFLRNGVAFKYTPIATYSIPLHPELSGISVRLPGGAYQAFSDSNFIVYSYGHTEHALKEGYGYAAPCGLILTVPSNVSPIITVDTFCQNWHVHIHDTRPGYLRFNSFQIYTDSTAAALLGLKLSTNLTALSPYPNLADSDIDFEISPANSSLAANGYLYLRDGVGNLDTITLLYSGSNFRYALRSQPSSFNMRVLTGSDTCVTIDLWNPDSSRTLPLTAAWLVYDSVFSIDTAGLAFPKMILPHDTLALQVCARVTDHDYKHIDTLTLETNCEQKIPLAILGLLPRVNWDRDSATDTLLCGEPDTVRVWLQNNSATHTTEIIDSVVISGPDASEFTMVANQFDYPQLVNFPMYYGEKAWIDIAFVPNMTKPLATRWADRDASIIAYNELNSNPVIQLTAHVTYGQIALDQSEIDFGPISLQASKSTTANLTNIGTASIIISRIVIGDTEVTISGIDSGEVVAAGETIPVTLTATAASADSDNVLIQIWTNSICTSPDTVIVTFAGIGKERGVQSLVVPAVFQPVFTCAKTMGNVTVTNQGPDTMHLLSLRVFGTPMAPDSSYFTLANGLRIELFDIRLPADSSISIPINYQPDAEGQHFASLEIEWDSLGIVTTTDVMLNAFSKEEHATLSTSISGVDTNYSTWISNPFSIPIYLNAPFDSSANIYRLPLSISFARDLFENTGVVAATGLALMDSNLINLSGNTILSFTLVSQVPIVSQQLCSLMLMPVVAIASRDTLSISADFAIDSAGDTLCLSTEAHPATILVGDSCSDNLLRDVMQNQPLFSIESIVPNPATATLRVEGSGQGVEVELDDALGRTTLFPAPYALPFTLDVASLPSGTHFLRLSENGYVQTRSVSIEH